MCAVTNFRVRHLPSVKRTPARFYFVKSYPFFNPPSAFRPISENLPDRGGLTPGIFYLIFKVTNVSAQSKIDTIKNRITILVSNKPFFW